jgi:hypothetical protein
LTTAPAELPGSMDVVSATGTQPDCKVMVNSFEYSGSMQCVFERRLGAMDIEDDAIVGAEAAGHFEHVDQSFLTFHGQFHPPIVATADVEIEIEAPGTVAREFKKTVAGNCAGKGEPDSGIHRHPSEVAMVFSALSLIFRSDFEHPFTRLHLF